MEKPKKRSGLRAKCGMWYYAFLRYLLWFKERKVFAKRKVKENYPYIYFEHSTPLMRKLKDVDMWLQENKVENLKIAAPKLDGIILQPGEVLSYWKLIGKPTYAKGYKDGMVLKNGGFSPGVGGGLCQMSNLIFWMTIHTPLTIVERHRHGYDVFPDANRTQPFGSGATCFYPHGDLMIRNDTDTPFQLRVLVGEKELFGQWRCMEEPEFTYEIKERNHVMQSEYWGGYSRHNELYQLKYDKDGKLLHDELIVKNDALMMYEPFLEAHHES
ncbi:MAG: VanW family protein [Lachnospiraceae bacterium]|nr:VanW family protein [Lachnospiraceae bacterium]